MGVGRKGRAGFWDHTFIINLMIWKRLRYGDPWGKERNSALFRPGQPTFNCVSLKGLRWGTE